VRQTTSSVVTLSALLGELLIVAAVMAACVALHAYLQHRFKSEVLRRHNDVAGYLFSAVGILYAVVLGFVVVVVWQKYDDTVSNVENEVAATADLYHVVEGYPEPSRSLIRLDLRRYIATVLHVEWPAMEQGERIPELGANTFEDAYNRINTLLPANWRQFAAQQAAIVDEQRLFDARRVRLVHTVPSVPGILWFALIAGAAAMIGFCFLFGVENRPAQLVMTATLVGLIGILFVVVNAFSTPFSGSVRISSDGWAYLQQRLPYIR